MTPAGRVLLLAAALVLAAGAIVAGQGQGQSGAASGLEADVVFTSDRGHVHASSIVETPSGALYVAWYENADPAEDGPFEGRDRDKREDVRIAGARRAAGARSWSEPVILADTAGFPDNNPALAIDAGNRLWLVFATLVGVPDGAWGTALPQARVSSDYDRDGAPRWDDAHVLLPRPPGLMATVAQAAERLRYADGRTVEVAARSTRLLERLADPYARRLGWMPRTHPVVLEDGALLVPFANENFNLAAMMITRDGGATWTTSAPVPTLGLIQPSVVDLGGGHLAAFFRDARGLGIIARSDSRDGGLTWSEAVPSGLPNPSGGIEAIRLASGRLAMVYNNHTGRERDRLAISISDDGGRSWPWTRQIADAPGQRFDYPSIIQARDGRLHVTFSDNLKTVRHVVLREEDVRR
jgi:predicted neuraminidase